MEFALVTLDSQETIVQLKLVRPIVLEMVSARLLEFANVPQITKGMTVQLRNA